MRCCISYIFTLLIITIIVTTSSPAILLAGEIKEGMNLGLEYARDEDYGNATGKNADIVNVLLAVEF